MAVDPPFPDAVFTLSTMTYNSHKQLLIRQGDDDPGKSSFIESATLRKLEEQRQRYPGLPEPHPYRER